MDFVKLNIHMNFSPDKVSKSPHLKVLERTRAPRTVSNPDMILEFNNLIVINRSMSGFDR